MTSSAAAPPDLGAVATQILADTTRELALRSPEMPQPVRDATDDYHDAIHEAVAAVDQLKRDRADLAARRDLIPGAGWQRLSQEATHQAEERVRAADQRAAVAFDQLRDALTDAALPRLDPAREQLARQELALVFQGPSGGSALARVNRIAQHGSREAVAALLSPFGRTLLASAGLTGRDLEEALQVARTHAAQTAVERSTSPGEITAALALRGVGKLSAARGAAGVSLRNVIGRQW